MSNLSLVKTTQATVAPSVPRVTLSNRIKCDTVYKAVDLFVASANASGAKFNEVRDLGAKYLIGLWLDQQKQLDKVGKDVSKVKAIKQKHYDLYTRFKAEIVSRLAGLNDQTQVSSHQRALNRAIDNLSKAYEGYKKPTSQTADAEKSKAKRARKAPAKKVTTKAKADVSPFDKKMTLTEVKREITNSMSDLYDNIIGFIPAGKVNDYKNIQTAFIHSVNVLLTDKK